VAGSRQHILERAGSGDAQLANAVAHLVTETSEARLTGLLDAALGADRRKLEALLEQSDIPTLARGPLSVGPDETPQSVADTFCGALGHEIAQLRAVQSWLGGGSANDLKAAARLAPFLANATRGFDLIGAFLMTAEGDKRKTMATKKLSDARPDLLAYLVELQNRYCEAAARHRAARAAGLAESALILIDAVRRDYAPSGCAAYWTMTT
jgi:ATP-dependent helicase/nuclease subunit A